MNITSVVDFPKCDFYSTDEDCETLLHDNPGDAIEEYLEENPDAENVTLLGFNRIILSEKDLMRLEDFYERVDEEYGNPNEETKIDPKIKTAWDEFVRVFLENYEPFACEVVQKRIVGLTHWMEKK